MYSDMLPERKTLASTLLSLTEIFGIKIWHLQEILDIALVKDMFLASDIPKIGSQL